MASHEIGALDLASLERFQTELIEAGFEPHVDDQGVWVGPLADSLKDMTSAKTMRVVFHDGWPFQHPRLYVDGLDERHVSASGEVCLWHSGASSAEWLTLDGYMRRIKEWAHRGKTSFHPEDFVLDAHLAFGRIRWGVLATEDLPPSPSPSSRAAPRP